MVDSEIGGQRQRTATSGSTARHVPITSSFSERVSFRCLRTQTEILLEDQVAKLKERGFAVERIHSGRPRADLRRACLD